MISRKKAERDENSHECAPDEDEGERNQERQAARQSDFQMLGGPANGSK
jgi:hypothetical protein